VLRLKDKVAVITGAGSGIGRATAKKFAEEGADVAIFYTFEPEEAQKTGEMVRAAGRRALVLEADVRRRDQVRAAVDKVALAWGRLDVMVSNAGIYRATPFLEISDDEWDDVLATNLKGAFNCGQAAARAMITAKSPGKILLISSTQAFRPLIGTAHYGASKSGMLALAKTMALELAPHHIGVVVINPGVSESAGNVQKLADPAVRREVESQIPWGRVGQPAEVANLAVFLASADAEYITGCHIVIDGGLLVAGPQV